MENNANFNLDQMHPQTQTTAPNSVLFAILSYIFILWIPGLVVEPEKNDPFVKAHVNNGIILTIIEVVAGLFAIIPVVGWIISTIIGIAGLVVMILGIVFAAQKQYFNIPVISDIKLVK